LPTEKKTEKEEKSVGSTGSVLVTPEGANRASRRILAWGERKKKKKKKKSAL